MVILVGKGCSICETTLSNDYSIYWYWSWFGMTQCLQYMCFETIFKAVIKIFTIEPQILINDKLCIFYKIYIC